MQWYYSKNGTQLGPVAQDELISKLAAGEVSPADLVWRDGMADWIAAGQVAELRTASPSTMSAGPSAEPAPYAPPSANPLPQHQQPYPVVLPPEARKAGTSMTLGIVAIVTGFLCGCLGGIPCGVLAIVFGNQYKKFAELNPAYAGDLSKAKSGILMGWIGIALAVIMTIITIAIQIAAGAFNAQQ